MKSIARQMGLLGMPWASALKQDITRERGFMTDAERALAMYLVPVLGVCAQHANYIKTNVGKRMRELE